MIFVRLDRYAEEIEYPELAKKEQEKVTAAEETLDALHCLFSQDIKCQITNGQDQLPATSVFLGKRRDLVKQVNESLQKKLLGSRYFITLLIGSNKLS